MESLYAGSKAMSSLLARVISGGSSGAKTIRLLHSWLPRRRRRRSPRVIRLIRLSYQELSLTRLAR